MAVIPARLAYEQDPPRDDTFTALDVVPRSALVCSLQRDNDHTPFGPWRLPAEWGFAQKRAREALRPPSLPRHALELYGPTSRLEPVEPRPFAVSLTRVSSSVASDVESRGFALIDTLE